MKLEFDSTTDASAMENNTLEEYPVGSLIGSRALNFMVNFYMPCMEVAGVLGNVLSIAVFTCTPSMRQLSSSHYLSALALSDSISLMCLFLVYLNRFSESKDFNALLCAPMSYTNGVTTFLSSWFVLAFTVERFVAVKYPFQSKYLCTVSHARILIVCLAVAALLLNAPLLIMTEVVQNECNVPEEWREFSMYFNICDTIWVSLAPVVCIMVLNTIISRHVFNFMRIRHRLTNTTPRTVNNGNANSDDSSRLQSAVAKKESHKLTKMLLLISTVCVILTVPSYIMRLLTHLDDLNYIVLGENTVLETQNWTMVMFYTNFAINFVLYCLSGQNFRRAAKNLIVPKKWHPQNDSRSLSTRNKLSTTTTCI